MGPASLCNTCGLLYAKQHNLKLAESDFDGEAFDALLASEAPEEAAEEEEEGQQSPPLVAPENELDTEWSPLDPLFADPDLLVAPAPPIMAENL